MARHTALWEAPEQGPLRLHRGGWTKVTLDRLAPYGWTERPLDPQWVDVNDPDGTLRVKARAGRYLLLDDLFAIDVK